MRTPLPFIAAALVLALLGVVMPDWMRFILQTSIGVALASLGLMLLMRAGLISFGQGLYFCVGGYCAALLLKFFDINDLALTFIVAIVASAVVAALVGAFIARYREIFFAMLTLALTMVFYALLVKTNAVGGSDGLNISPPTFLGLPMGGHFERIGVYYVSVVAAAMASFLVHRFMTSEFGRLSEAVKSNELRLAYLGAKVRIVVVVNYVVAAGLAGLGGAICALTARHVDPAFAYWTTSAEFVFAVLIGGRGHVAAPFVGAIFLDVLRSVALEIAPTYWQMILGVLMLSIILLLPDGLLAFAMRLRHARR